jgi:hypothetical protein
MRTLADFPMTEAVRSAAMGKVTSDISMSLDGFITDPKASVGTPLEGNDPGRLHDWKFDAKTDAECQDRRRALRVDGSRSDREEDVRRRIRAVG